MDIRNKLDLNLVTFSTQSGTAELTVMQPCGQSERERRSPIRYGIDEIISAIASVNHTACAASEISEPKDLSEAMSSEHAKE